MSESRVCAYCHDVTTSAKKTVNGWLCHDHVGCEDRRLRRERDTLRAENAALREVVEAARGMRESAVVALREYTKDRRETLAYNTATHWLGEFDDALSKLDALKEKP